MGALFRLAQEIAGPAANDLYSMALVFIEQLLETEGLRTAADKGDVDDAECGAELGKLIELVNNHLGRSGHLELDNQPDVLIALVPDIRNVLDATILDTLGNLLDDRNLVLLVGDLGKDDRILVLAGLDMVLGAHLDQPPPCPVGLTNTGPPADLRPGGEVRARDVSHQLFYGDVGVRDKGAQAGAHLSKVVRRHARRHANGDPRRPIAKQVRESGREHAGFVKTVVEGLLMVDRLLVDIGHQLNGPLGHPRLGIPHGSRRIAVDRAKVALAVNERVAGVEGLGHAHERGVDGAVSMRMIAHHGLTHDGRALAMPPAGSKVQIPHGHEDSALRRLQAIANVWKRPLNDDAHGIGEVGLLELILDIQLADLFASTKACFFVFCHIALRHQGSSHPGHAPG